MSSASRPRDSTGIMMNELIKKLKALRGLALPILALLFGILLMLLPSGGEEEAQAADADRLLAELFSECREIGKAKVLISESGVIVVCEGAEKASVRLDILRAVYSYTGFGSDKVTILEFAHGA